MNRIILLGFRYSGKSFIGKTIADINNFKFIDLDEKIEKQQKTSISKIVKKYGWKHFRELESQEYKNHLMDDSIVISCGGGFGVNEYFLEEEKELLKQDKGLKILLEINNAELIERIKKYDKRPSLIGNNNRNNSIDKIIDENIAIYQERKKLYDELDYDCKIDTSNDKICNAIIHKTLCCVIGYPVWHSLSPKIHNFLYQTQKLNNFVYTKIEIKPEKIGNLKQIIKTLNILGLSITSPYKQEVMKIVDKIDKKAEQIDAVNTIFVDKNNKLIGYNTDWFGVSNALKKSVDLKNKKIAIFGSGGGAKSAVIGCLDYTKNIALFNRTKEKNDNFAKQNNIKSYSLEDFKTNEFDIIINATTVGLGTDESILTKDQLLKNQVIFDIVYNPLNTTLLKNAISKDAKIIHGTEMLIYQAIKQYEIFTNKKINNKEIISQIENTIINKNHNICLVVFGKTLDEFLKNLKLAQQKSDFLELRVDYIKDLSKNTIDLISQKVAVDTIFTCRHKENGGEFLGTQKQQKDLIKYAMSLNKFTYFDIDFSQIKDWKQELKDKNKNYKIILSHHNFNKCLSYKDCKKIIDKMFKSGADISKIACKIDKIDDIIIMLKVLKKYNKDNKKVIFAPMCDNGMIRLLANKFGSWTNFLCLNHSNSTAKGQISIDDYYKLSDLLNNSKI